MRLSDGDTLDVAISLIEEHSWRTHMPDTSPDHVAELVAVLMPLYQRTPPKQKPRKITANKPVDKTELSPESSRIPSSIRSAVIKRDGWSCQRCGRGIWGIRYGLQHRRPRQMGGSRRLHTMANLVVLCGWTVDKGTCTEWVELLDRTQAAADGWLVPHGVTPEEWPVFRFGRSWQQPGDEWVPADPHPRQAGEAA